jgi:hypothetical protein
LCDSPDWRSGCTRCGFRTFFYAAVCRETAAESTAPAGFAFYFQPSFVTQQYMFDDRQTQTGTAAGAGTAGIDPVETFGETRNVVMGYTHA